MAKYGAKYLRWAPFASTDPEPENALPNYGSPISMGALVKVTDAPAFNEGKLYGDNALAEYVNEFKECPVDVELTELSNAVAAGMLGATLTAGDGAELQFAAGDNAPYGCLGFYISKKVNNINKFQGVFYPKAKAAMQGDEYATQGDGVTLTGGKLKLTASPAKNGQWKLMSDDLDSEDEAKTWVDGKVKAAAGNTPA